MFDEPKLIPPSWRRLSEAARRVRVARATLERLKAFEASLPAPGPLPASPPSPLPPPGSPRS
jgi:hypothetical protein